MPRCGGTSLRAALREAYASLAVWKDRRRVATVGNTACVRAAEQLDVPELELRSQVLHYLLAGPAHRLVQGHAPASASVLDHHADAWSFLTVLRDPVERWTSHYFYDRYKDRDDFGAIDADLASFLDTDRAQRMGRAHVDYLAAEATLEEAGTAPVEAALANLDRFAAVGFLDDLGAFARRVEREVGVELDVDHRNRNPAGRSERERELAGHRERIRKLCEPDLRLYERARERFG